MEQLDLGQYELMIILPPDMKEQDLNTRLNDIRASIKEDGGKILNEELVGLRDFAYRVGKYERGFYALFYFEHLPAKIPALDRTVRIEMAVLRHLLLRAPRDYFFKTFKEYGAEAETAAAAEEQERKADEFEKRKPARARMERPEKPEAPAKGEKLPVKEKEEVVLSEEDLQAKLKAEEAKLQSLLDNPDIQI